MSVNQSVLHARLLLLPLLCSLGLAACAPAAQKEASGGGDRAFEKYTKELFCSQVSSNTISLHYTLKDPEKYGIQEETVSPGRVETDPSAVRASAENVRSALEAFSREDLDLQNRITYDILEYQMDMTEEMAGYLLYEEPLGLVSGVQTQYPVVLSEYRFYDQGDVDVYLELLESTGEYFDSLLDFEKKKSTAGLFMSDEILDSVLEQCRAFLDMGDGNYLYSTFADRIKEADWLTEEEKSDYIQDNARGVSDFVLPAYEKLMNGLEELRGTGKNTKGLSGLPGGKDYYEQLARLSTGSGRSVEELQDLARQQISDDLDAMEQAFGMTKEEAAQTASAAVGQNAPEQILEHLKKEIGTAFPELPDTDPEVKYVPEQMEEHLSPAFYMIPAIDNSLENVIYINQAHMDSGLTLFTTLAHEGYPGHLYQTVYYESTDPDPIRSLMDFGGYTEGWATYGEMGSYYLLPIPRQQAVFLQKNSSIILALYALADMGIHYDGWSRMDTVSFFSAYGITDAQSVEQIYELILGSPANYLKYYIGYVEFLELKKQWAVKLGDQFRQKEFHRAVLNVGPAPFDIVEDYMWQTGEEE